MFRKLTSCLALALLAGACTDAGTPAGPARLAPFVQVSGNLTTQLIPNEYIVVLRDQSRSDLDAAVNSVTAAGGTIVARYEHVFRGFAARMDASALNVSRGNVDVLFVQPNGVVQLNGTQSPSPSWGLDRIDQRTLPLDNSFTYPANEGAGVHEYTIDTGILLTHNDFSGRVGNGFDAITSGGNANDCNGHGTHVTGTAAGTTYGIAKKATVHPVRVLNCSGSGSFAQVIAGMDWVTANRIQPAVANMSLGGSKDVATNMAADSIVKKGNVALAVASGNNSWNACNDSPASAPLPLTVNASASNDARASFSNFGSCTDLFAPGVSIKSDWIGSNSATNTISGTSMASPHVAGALALYRAADPSATALVIQARLLADATPNLITNPGSLSPNLLLYIGNIAPPGPNNPPVAAFVSSCVERPNGRFRCDFDGTSSTDDHGVTAYLWSTPGEPNQSGPTASFGFDPGTTHDVTLKVTDAGGLSTSITHTINVGAPQQCALTLQQAANGTAQLTSGSATGVCGRSLTVQATASNGFTFTQWSDGNTSNPYTFTLGTDLTLSPAFSQNPPPNQPPVAAFTYSCTLRPNGRYRCDFDGSSSSDDNGIASFLWTSAGEPDRSGSTAIFGFEPGTSNQVTLKVTDADGLTNSLTKTIVLP
ncbi:MAG: S8 family serine peptidase [Gemmatimonadaceae bacterium]